MVFAQFFSAAPRYDAMLHAIFLGFVFSMIFARAPIILLTITGLALPLQNTFYLHAGLLHLSVLLRIAGDLSLALPLQRWAGLLRRGDLTLLGQQCARGALGRKPPFHSKKLIRHPADFSETRNLWGLFPIRNKTESEIASQRAAAWF